MAKEVKLIYTCFIYFGLVKEDFYPVASRPRHSLYELISVDDAVNIILQNTPNNCTIEERPLLSKYTCSLLDHFVIIESLNCVLSKSLVANQPFPPFPASVKDGYAVISKLLTSPAGINS